MNRIPVTSSNVVSIGYDAASQILEIEFKSAIYHYTGVPADVHAELMSAPSAGKAVNTLIVGKYPFVKGELIDG